MTKKLKRYTQPYDIGFDIGTNSIGYALIDSDLNLVRVKGKTALGARLFKGGQTAAERRDHRAEARRLKRRHHRLSLLNQIFAPYLKQIDPTFLQRIKESDLANGDPKKHFTGSTLFPDWEFGDSSYNGKNGKYKTPYHLRYALMTEHRKFDLRLVYLAIHHTIKYRGNFLSDSSVKSFVNKPFDLTQVIDTLQSLYVDMGYQEDFTNQFTNQLQTTLHADLNFRMKTKRALAQLVNDPASNFAKGEATEILKAILNHKFSIEKLFPQLNADSLSVDDKKTFTLGDEDVDVKLTPWFDILSDDEINIISLLQRWHDRLVLDQIVVDGKTLSASMIDRYNEYGKQLHALKRLIQAQNDRQLWLDFQDLYGHYSDARKESLRRYDFDPKKGYPSLKFLSRDIFVKDLQKLLDRCTTGQAEIDKINDLISHDKYLVKLRTKDNGVIPHQMHQLELETILKNQGEYYPWLLAKNTNQYDLHKTPYLIAELLAFRIPYYAGPLTSMQTQIKNGGGVHAWAVFKDGVKPQPVSALNFSQMIDLGQSANVFIDRMRGEDTYLLDTKTLPDESFLYEKFKVLNELNGVSYGAGLKLTSSQKQAVYRDVFTKYKSVSVKVFKNYLVSHGWIMKSDDIHGLSDPTHFSNGLGSYIDFKKIFGADVDDPTKLADFEKMIAWSTVFEDKKIFLAKLQTIDWLTDDQRKQVLNHRYRGWGKLSYELLTQYLNRENRSIIDELWETNNMFMTAVTDTRVSSAIEQHNQKYLKQFNTVKARVESVLDSEYMSPQNKKAIRQVVKLYLDICNVMGHAPEHICIEFTRSPDNNPQRTQLRYQKVFNLYQKLGRQITPQLNQELSQYQTVNHGQLADKLMLYFLQKGRDIYDGTNIDIDKLPQYDIDHILPQSFIKDDSLDNRVLTKKKLNLQKTNRAASQTFPKMMPFWDSLVKQGLMTKKKFHHLITDPDPINGFNKYQQRGFIQRQIVETSQVIKVTANLLQAISPESSVIEVPAKSNTQMRKFYGFLKNRDLNDYHHAFDAYLTVLNGTYLCRRYPKLRPFFVYNDQHEVNLDTLKLKRFNFFYDVTLRKDAMTNNNLKYFDVIKHYKEVFTTVAPRVWLYRKLVISQDTYQNHGQLFNATRYSSHDKNATIPLGKDKPIELYGGFNSNQTAYMFLIRVNGLKNKQPHYRLINVPRRLEQTLNHLRDTNTEQYIQMLMKMADESKRMTASDRKAGFHVAATKILINQLFIDGPMRFRAVSERVQQSISELTLSKEAVETLDVNLMRTLYDVDDLKSPLNQRYDDCYQEITDVVANHFGMMTYRKRNQKLEDGFAGFKSLSMANKRIVLQTLLGTLHANPTDDALDKNLPLKAPAKKALKLPKGLNDFSGAVVLSNDTYMILQSPSGLQTRKIYLKDLPNLD